MDYGQDKKINKTQLQKDLHQTDETPFNIKGLKIGVVTKVKENDNGFLLVNIHLYSGGNIKDVPYYGGNIDETTLNLHGIFVPPRKGQVAVIGFLNADYTQPIIVNSFALPNLNIDRLANPLKNINKDEITVNHFSGAQIKITASGEIDLITDKKIRLNGKEGVLFNTPNGFSVKTDAGFRFTGKNFIFGEGTRRKAARQGDKIMCSSDNAGKYFFDWVKEFFIQVDTLATALQTWVPVPQDGGAALKTQLANFFVTWAALKVKYPLAPTFVMGEIVSGSTEVFI